MSSSGNRHLNTHLSPVGAWAFAVGTSVGWGSLVVTANTYLAQAGPAGSVLGLLIGAAVMLVISRNYAYMINCFPEAGGAYTYCREVFGHDYGFLAAWFLILTYLAMLWANATSIPLFARYFISDLFQVGRLYTLFGYDVYLGEALLSVAAIVLIALLCTRQKSLVTRLMIAMAFIFAIGITAVLIGALTGRDVSMSPAFVPDAKALSQVIKIAVISPWAFIGFENISHAAEEYSFKRSKIFRVFVAAVITTVLLYVFVTLLSVTAYPSGYDSWYAYMCDHGNLDGLAALPAFYAAHHYMGNAGVGILMVSLLALIATSLIGNITALSRLLYALGRDKILPQRFAQINKSGVPAGAIWLIVGVSVLIPFLGRTAIGWIVDVTTIGATLIYGFVSASTTKLAARRNDRTEAWTGRIGLTIMILFGLYILLPNLLSSESMAKESYFLFIVWSILGFLFFRSILQRDKERRFGKSVIVWVALLALVLLIALIWMRQSMIDSNNQMVANIREHYEETSDISELRQLDEKFIEDQMVKLDRADSRTVMMATGMFAFALLIMVTNYSFMNKRAKESEELANRDKMTGVKSKHAYITRENELNDLISRGLAEPFAIAVCDVNGLKQVNDTLGHKAGDDYIRSASAMICELFDHSPVYRVGGDEFTVLLTGRDLEDCNRIMSDLRAQSAQNSRTGDVVVASGISLFTPGQDETVQDVFERADAEMYQNKKALKSQG